MEQSLEPVSTEYWSVRKLDGTFIRIRKVENCMVIRQTDRQTETDRQTGRQVDGQEDRQLGGWTGERTETDRQSHSPHDGMSFFGKRKTDVIVPVCPPMLLISRPVSASHNLSMVSRLQRRPVMNQCYNKVCE